MFDHIPDKRMEAFCARALMDSELAAIAEHIASCGQCQWLFQETLKRERGSQIIPVSLSPANWFRHEHLDYDRLESFAENRFDAEETAIVNLHHESCAVCREDARSYFEFRDATENKTHSRHPAEPRSPRTKKPSYERKPSANRWKPAHAIMALLILGTAILAAVFFSTQGVIGRKSRIPESPQAISTESSPPTPASSPSESVTPNPAESGEDVVASLADGERTVRFNEAGVVSGLETFPEAMRQDITEALLTGAPRRSTALSELMRDPERGSSAALLYPRRIVITEDRPNFRWAPIAGASSYQIRVSDPDGNQIANSGQLTSDTTQWRPSTRLKRGVIYWWDVIAMVNGKWTASETNFKLLGGEKLGELTMLKNQYQSHLALGLFYLREGALVEARRELELLVKDNPNSPIAAKLLSQAHSWR